MEEKHCFVQDNSGHWFFIPLGRRIEFYELLEWSDIHLDYSQFIYEFLKYKCLHPNMYIFYSLEERK